MAKTALGTYIQNTRKKRGLTQAQVAEKIPVDVEPDTIGKIEQGEIENPSMPVLRGIASVLGISLSSLTSKLPAGAKPAPKFAPFSKASLPATTALNTVRTSAFTAATCEGGSEPCSCAADRPTW